MSIIKRRLAGLIFENFEPKQKKTKVFQNHHAKILINYLLIELKKIKYPMMKIIIIFGINQMCV